MSLLSWHLFGEINVLEIYQVEMKNEKIKFEKYFHQFDKPTSCLDFIEHSLKDKHVLFLTSNIYADELFLKRIASLSNFHRIYIYNQQGNDYQVNNKNLEKKMGSKRIIQFDECLYEEIVLDLIDTYLNESDRLEKGKEAKELLETAVKLLDTLGDKDEDLQKIENNLITRINRLK